MRKRWWYTSNDTSLYDATHTGNINSVNTLGIQRKLFGNKVTLKINVNGIFWTNRARATAVFTGYVELFDVGSETRVATPSFAYKFGKKFGSGL